MAPEGCIPCMASGEFSPITPTHRCVEVLPDPPCSTRHAAAANQLARHGSKRGSMKQYGVKAVQGARSYMEDTHVAMSKFMSFKCANRLLMHRVSSVQRVRLQLYGVFDGHGGAAVAEHCADTLPKRLYDSIKSLVASQITERQLLPPSFASPSSSPAHADVDDVVSQTLDTIIPSAMEMSFKDTDDSLRDGTVAAWTGTTAIVAVVGLRSIWIANCGDSRAVLCHQGTAVPLSKDHKPSCPAEAERIARTGGVVVHNYGRRVMGVLSVSRAIGDHSFQQYGLTAEPEIETVERKPGDEFLLLASDGLWEVMSNDDAIQLARRCFLRAKSRGAGPGAAARISANVLIRVALGRGSGDNITVLVVDLTPDAEQHEGGNGVMADKWSSANLGSEDGSSGGDDVVEGLLRVSGSGAQEGTLRQKEAVQDCETTAHDELDCSDAEQAKHTPPPSAEQSPTEQLHDEAQHCAPACDAAHDEACTTCKISPAERSYSNLTLMSDGDSSDGEHHVSDTEVNQHVPETIPEEVEPDASHAVDTTPATTKTVGLVRQPTLSPFADHSWQQEDADFSFSQPSSPLTDSGSSKQASPSKQDQDGLFLEADADLSVTSPFYLHPYSPTGSATAASTPTTIDHSASAKSSTQNATSPTEGPKEESCTSRSPFSLGPVTISPFEMHNSTASSFWDECSNASTSPFMLPPGAVSPFEVGPGPDLSDNHPAMYGDVSYKPAHCSGSGSAASSRTMVSSGEQEPRSATLVSGAISRMLNDQPSTGVLHGQAGSLVQHENVPSGNPFKEASRHSEPLPSPPAELQDSGSLDSLTSTMSILGKGVLALETSGVVSGKPAKRPTRSRVSPFASTQRQRAKSCNSIELPSPFWLEQEARSIELKHKAASLPSPTAILTGEELTQLEAGMRLFKSIRLDHSKTDSCPLVHVPGQGTSDLGEACSTGSTGGTMKAAPAFEDCDLGVCLLSAKSLADIPECLGEDDREYSLGQWLKPSDAEQTTGKTQARRVGIHTGNVTQTLANTNCTVNTQKKHAGDNKKSSCVQLRHNVYHNAGAGQCGLSALCSEFDSGITRLGRSGNFSLKTHSSLPLTHGNRAVSTVRLVDRNAQGCWHLTRFGSSGLELLTAGV